MLLLSIDGLHALDLANYIKAKPHSNFAALVNEGVNFTNASSARPSDSFPGLLALVTGGSPICTGVWYDDSYDRALSPPAVSDPPAAIRSAPARWAPKSSSTRPPTST